MYLYLENCLKVIEIQLIRFQLDLVRKTSYGLIRGYVARSETNSTIEFYAFKKVPYARAPLGKLRFQVNQENIFFNRFFTNMHFQEPVPPTKWPGIINTTNPSERCVQIKDDFNGEGVIGNEDCLYLEIFEPITVNPFHFLLFHRLFDFITD